MDKDEYGQYRRLSAMVAGECAQALKAVNGEEVDKYLTLIEHAGKVFFTGTGRVLLSLQAIAKRYAHLGTCSVIVGEITEPAITKKDVLVVGSGSGETLIPSAVARKAGAFGAAVIHIGSNPSSSLKDVADLFVRIPVWSKAGREDEIQSCQPMTSLFEQALLLFGDTTALMMIENKGIDLRKLWGYHANLE